jgi:hypothetical protein
MELSILSIAFLNCDQLTVDRKLVLLLKTYLFNFLNNAKGKYGFRISSV